MLGDSRRQRPQQGLRRAMTTTAAIAGREIDASTVASARTHFAGQRAHKCQARPLPDTKAAKYLALGVFDGGMNRVRRRTWRQPCTSRRIFARLNVMQKAKCCEGSFAARLCAARHEGLRKKRAKGNLTNTVFTAGLTPRASKPCEGVGNFPRVSAAVTAHAFFSAANWCAGAAPQKNSPETWLSPWLARRWATWRAPGRRSFCRPAKCRNWDRRWAKSVGGRTTGAVCWPRTIGRPPRTWSA